jgi:SAM-dependent methyltransferase
MDDEKIKVVVKRNFDESTERYCLFEDKYSFFKNLTKELSSFCGLKEGMDVLDVGCGTGASTFYLSDMVRCNKVIGIDISDRMLSAAIKHAKPNTKFVVGDAENMCGYVCDKFDAVVYNASLFLIPSPRKSLTSAKNLLKTNGICGASYIGGLFSSGMDVIEDARRRGAAGDGRFVTPDDIKQSFKETFGSYETKYIDLPIGRDPAEEFHLIPAQSASLFPRRSYSERVTLVRALFSEFKKKYTGFKMRWEFIKANSS